METTFNFSGEIRRRSPISLTPLIDVVFILLLFFMLSSTFSPLFALDITTSSSGAAEVLPDERPVIIQIVDGSRLDISGSVYEYVSAVSIQPLTDAVKDNVPVLVRAEATASVQHVVSALVFLEQQGVSNLHLGESVGAADAQ